MVTGNLNPITGDSRHMVQGLLAGMPTHNRMQTYCRVYKHLSIHNSAAVIFYTVPTHRGKGRSLVKLKILIIKKQSCSVPWHGPSDTNQGKSNFLSWPELLDSIMRIHLRLFSCHSCLASSPFHSPKKQHAAAYTLALRWIRPERSTSN